MPTAYAKALPDDGAAPAWDFSRDTPDDVVINLGTNDFRRQNRITRHSKRHTPPSYRRYFAFMDGGSSTTAEDTGSTFEAAVTPARMEDGYGVVGRF